MPCCGRRLFHRKETVQKKADLEAGETVDIREIGSLDIPELRVYSALTETQLRSREYGLFIAESVKVIGHALDAGYEPVSVLSERRHLTGKAKVILDRMPDIPVYTGEREVLSNLTGYELTRGVLCAMRRRTLPSLDTICSKADRLCILENITDSTNIGAIFRAAAGLGMDAVLLTPSCCDPLCRRSVRVSMGTVFQVPWTYLPDWNPMEMRSLKERGFCLAAMALDERAVMVDDPILSKAEKLAIILGTEGEGLMASTLAESDYSVMIPMKNGVDSLNVGAAAAVAFWQLRK